MSCKEKQLALFIGLTLYGRIDPIRNFKENLDTMNQFNIDREVLQSNLISIVTSEVFDYSQMIAQEEECRISAYRTAN